MNLRISASAAALAAGFLLLLAGCGAAKPIKYYSLDFPEVSASGQPTDVALLIGHFGAPELYRDTRIVYRTGPNELGLYEEHRWAEPPAMMVEEMVLQTLRKSGRYKSVQPLASNAQGDYVVRGRIERFEEVDGKPLAARVSLRLTLYDLKSGTTVWAGNYDQDEPVSGEEFSAIVAALDSNLRRGVLQLTGEIGQYIAAHPRPPAAAK